MKKRYLALAVGVLTRSDLLVINKMPLAALNTHIAIAGYTPDASAVVYSYGIPQDEAARTGVGSPDVARVDFSGAGPTFSYTFPAYSATVLSLQPAPR